MEFIVYEVNGRLHNERIYSHSVILHDEVLIVVSTGSYHGSAVAHVGTIMASDIAFPPDINPYGFGVN